MLATPKLYKGKVVIYYHKHNTLRFSTGISATAKDLLSDGYFKKSVKDSESKNQILTNLLNQANSIIKEHVNQYGEYPTGSYLKHKLRQSDKKIRNADKFLEIYADYVEHKKIEFSQKERSIKSLKDYISTYNSFLDYQLATNKTLLLEDFNLKLLEDYKLFLEKPRKGKEFKTHGNLSLNTIKKRFDCLRAFFNRLETVSQYPFPKDFKGFKISSSEVEILSLTKDEVWRFEKIELPQKENRIRDLFIFTCLTGLRWSDVETLDKSHIKNENGIYFINKITIKNKVEVKIPLVKWAHDFLIKMNYNLRFISQQKYNDNLKSIAQKSNLFNDFMKTKKANGSYFMRWEKLTAHKGRHTFISNLVKSSVPVNEIMKYSGHKKLETLMKYINRNTPITTEYVNTLMK